MDGSGRIFNCNGQVDFRHMYGVEGVGVGVGSCVGVGVMSGVGVGVSVAIVLFHGTKAVPTILYKNSFDTHVPQPPLEIGKPEQPSNVYILYSSGCEP